MARTTLKINYTQPFEQVDNTVANILMISGYKKIERKGEVIWKKGTGFLTAMQYIKIEYTEDNTVVAQGWIQAGLGNLEAKEMALHGAAGSIPKKSVMKVLEKIQSSIN